MSINHFFSTYLSVCCLSCISAYAHTPAEALHALAEAPYGFCFFDVGITERDLTLFDQLIITKTASLDLFETTEFPLHVIPFLRDLGTDNEILLAAAAQRITDIVELLIHTSDRTTAWISLRALVPTDLYDLARWHMDGFYFSPQGPEELLYKFAITLRGASTLFYPVIKEERRAVWYKTPDRAYMNQLCKPEKIIRPERGEGVVFLSGRVAQSALHAEPPIDEVRLFLSVVPCDEKQIEELKKRVRYQPVNK